MIAHYVYTFRCCNTCDEVREAYRKKGWAFKGADNIEQCKREGWGEKMKAQQNEGCMVFGFIEVNKVMLYFHKIWLTHFSQETAKRETGELCRPRSDAAECGIWSGSVLCALNTGIPIKHSYNKNQPDTLLLEIDLSKELWQMNPLDVNGLISYFLYQCVFYGYSMDQ